MDVFKTAGAFSWSELMTTDPQAAAEFYRQLFGWSVETSDMGQQGSYRVVKVGDAAIGGIMAMPPDLPQGVPAHWGCYVTVDSVESTIERCTSLGGKVVAAPMDIPQVGRMAVIQDPQGAVLAIIAYAD